MYDERYKLVIRDKQIKERYMRLRKASPDEADLHVSLVHELIEVKFPTIMDRLQDIYVYFKQSMIMKSLAKKDEDYNLFDSLTHMIHESIKDDENIFSRYIKHNGVVLSTKTTLFSKSVYIALIGVSYFLFYRDDKRLNHKEFNYTVESKKDTPKEQPSELEDDHPFEIAMVDNRAGYL